MIGFVSATELQPMIELNPVRQRIADLTGRLRFAQGVSLTTTPRSNVSKK